jgi:hypothetical protein
LLYHRRQFPLNDNSSSSFHERTDVLYGSENIQRRVLETFSRVKEQLDGCTDPNDMALNTRFDAIWNALVAQKKRYKIKINNRSYT